MLFRWIKEYFALGREEENPGMGSVQIFAKNQRIVLVPSSRLGRRQTWPNPDRAVILEAGDEASLGSGVAEALKRSTTDVVSSKPPREKGDVVDKVTHELIGVSAKKGFFRKVKYGQIDLKDSLVTFYPSKHGAIMADLPVFEAPIEDLARLSSFLQETIKSTV